MFRKVLALALGVVAAGGIVGQAEARDRLVLLATQSLEPGAKSATIDVSKAPGAYRAVRVRAKSGPVTISGLRIVYNDDSFHTIDKTFTLNSKEQTKLLDEQAASKFVDTVAVTYGDTAANQPIVVEIYGLQDRQGSSLKRSKSAAAAAANAPNVPATTPATTGTIAAATPPPVKPKPIFADPAKITEGRDVMFGYQTVALNVEREKMKVDAEVGKFQAIRLKANADVHVVELRISYADGKDDVLAIDAPIKANQKSKWYAVNDQEFIKEIELVYRAKPTAKGQARVEVVGQYADKWLAPEGDGRKYNKGWVLLGAQTAGAIGFDRDVISVGKNEGGFSQIQLKVRDRSITLREVRIVYFDGPPEIIRTNDRIDPDQLAGPWTLKSGKPAIKEIVAEYRRRILIGKGQGAAVVEFWGQH